MAFEFIPPSELIKRLRETMPQFADRVAGGAQFDAFEDDTDIPVPSAFVMLGNNGAETLSIQTSLQQRIPHTFDIVLYLDSKDLRKQEPEELSVAFKKDIIRALNGWKPEAYPDSTILAFTGDQLHDTAADRYARIFQFEQSVDFDSSYDGLDDGLPDFNTLIGPFLHGDDDTNNVDLSITDLHE